MIKKPIILACTDFSDSSQTALLMAERIRKSTDGTLYVIHVSDVIYQLEAQAGALNPTAHFGEFSEIIRKSLVEKLAKQITDLKIKAEPIFVQGLAVASLLAEVSRLGVNLVVMGYSGSGNLGKKILGSFTQKMIKASKVPVLVTKNDLSFSKVTALVDDSEQMKAVIKESEELSQTLGLDLEVLSLWQDYPLSFASYSLEYTTLYMSATREEKEKVLKTLREKIMSSLSGKVNAKVKVEMTREYKIGDALSDILNDDPNQLVVMGSHGKNLLERIVIGSETLRVLELFDGNLFVLPEPQASAS